MTNYELLKQASEALNGYCENHELCDNCELSAICEILPLALGCTLEKIAENKEARK